MKFLDPDKPSWQRSLALEVLHKMTIQPDLLNSFCSCYDLNKHTTSIFQDIVNSLGAYVQSLFINPQLQMSGNGNDTVLSPKQVLYCSSLQEQWYRAKLLVTLGAYLQHLVYLLNLVFFSEVFGCQLLQSFPQGMLGLFSEFETYNIFNICVFFLILAVIVKISLYNKFKN